MSILSSIYAIRRYGLKGIFEYLARAPRKRLFMKSIERTLRPDPPSIGITLIACFDYPGSLSKVMRDLAIKLNETGIPYQTLNIPCDNPIPSKEFGPFLTPKDDFCLNKYTHIFSIKHPIQVSDKRCKVHCIEFWEFEDGFVESCPEALRAQNILAFSNFDRDVFRHWLPGSIGVSKILYPFQFIHGELAPVEETRRKYGLGTNDFIVFFNFDYESSYYRKNPEGILYAFAQTLSDKPNARILFKTMRAKKCMAMSTRLHALANKLGISGKVTTIDDFIPQEDIVNLTNACDVYMSLHRGEGFGLGIAEAMSLGKAIITTNYSSTTEFCNAENSVLIPYKILSVPPEQIDNDAYRFVTAWAEPDTTAAASALLRLYNDPMLRRQLGDNAKRFITDYFSPINFRKSVEDFYRNA